MKFPVLTTLLFVVVTSSAHGATWDLLGYGAQNQALGNSTMSRATDANSQAYNPALMALQKKTLFSMGVQGSFAKFEPISQVLVDTTTLGGATNLVSNVNTDVPHALVSTLAVQTPLSKTAERPLHLGLNISAPLERILSLDTQDSFQPQYETYLNDTQRLNLSITLAQHTFEDWSFGIGTNIYLLQGTNGRVRLPAGGNSTARLKTEVKAGLAPILGTVYKIDEHFKAAFSWRAKQDHRSQFDFTNTISLLGPSDLVVIAKNSLFYDPETFMLGASYEDDLNSLSASAHWQQWGDFRSTVVGLTFLTYPSFSQNLPNTWHHDIISAHLGYERRSGDSSYRLGLAYVPTAAPDQSGESNILDSDRYEASLGYGYKWMSTFIGSLLRVDGSFLVHYLQSKTVTKTSSAFIGSPGYKIGGVVYGYGLTLTAEY